MDLYAAKSLGDFAFSLNKQQQNSMYTNGAQPRANDMPSQRNAYESTYMNNVFETERRAGTQSWNLAQNPMETGVVPRPAYADMFASPDQDGFGTATGIKTMSGHTLSSEEFTHQNMVPFLTKTSTQNMDVERTPYASRLETFTGNFSHIQPKKEVACFFEPTKDLTNPCGFMKNNNDFYMNRIEPPKNQNNTFPIPQVRVGKGLGLGFTAEGAGGFQQANTVDYARPKNIDELRAASDQSRKTNESRTQEAGAGTFQRAIVAPFSKNRPDTFYEQCPEQLIGTSSTVSRERVRPIPQMKATARVDSHTNYQGSAKTVAPGRGTSDDYGLSKVMTFSNSRDITGTQSIVNNITSTVKALIAPLLDVFKDTNKEYTLEAAREFGNFQTQMPMKPATYDPVNHRMRTTTKETTIYDASDMGTMHAQMPEKGTTYDPTNHIMRVTTKETTIVDASDAGSMHVQAPEKIVTYDPVNHVMKVTVKQTTIHDLSELGAVHPQMPGKGTTYDPVNHVLRTTIKETTLHDGSDAGFMSAQMPEKISTYDPVNHVLRTTIKQTTIHDTVTGNLKSTEEHGPMAPLDDAKKTIRQTIQEYDTVRNIGGHKYTVTMYNVDKAKTTIKQTTLDPSSSMYGFVAGQENHVGAYDVIDVEMPNTQKQFSSDYEYEGIAGAQAVFKEKSYEAEMNMEVDPTRDVMNKAAGYTPNGAGGFTGQDPSKFDQQAKRLVVDSVAARQTANPVAKQLTAKAIEPCEVTNKNDYLNGGEKRLDGTILAGLRSNPFSININPVQM